MFVFLGRHCGGHPPRGPRVSPGGAPLRPTLHGGQLWKDEWQRAGASDPGALLRQWKPQIDKNTLRLYEGMTPAERSVLLQARTGKIRLNDWLFQAKRTDRRTCPQCPARRLETLHHVIICKRLAADDVRVLGVGVV
ncbi:hypothetical protein BDW42DRAFT_197313 [Aspergillus taichungensis]|uniref:Uncharacterized protein n=1 Tax=Aspergillus taichungensis TaxID=482145 RepID=A0A2J5HGX7_9EURO|nr:hypothetical protein BDW42DRAFT_197313 [Aspergillus taichungensis]